MDQVPIQNLHDEVKRLEKGKLTDDVFRVMKKKCFDDEKKEEESIVVYPKTFKDLQELKQLTEDQGYDLFFHDSNYSANACFKGQKHIAINMRDFDEGRTRFTFNPSQLKGTIGSGLQKNVVAVVNKVNKVLGYKETARNMEECIKNNLGDCPKIKEENFSNWEGTQRTNRVLASYPETLEQLKNVVKYAGIKKLRVRCAGSKHSWAPLFADENQICIYLTQLKSDYPDGKKIRFAQGSQTQVDVMTGVTNADVKSFQLENKVNLPCNVILTAVQLVSVVATGCHGVGRDCKSPGDYVTKMRIIDSSGELRTYTTENKDQMKAIQANFGLFGIIFDITVEMEKQVIVQSKNVYQKVGDVFYKPEKLKEILENNWSVEMFWFPYNSCPIVSYHPEEEDVYIREINVSSKPGKLQSEEYYRDQHRWDGITQVSMREANPILTNVLNITPYAQGTSFKLLKNYIYPEGTIYQELPQAVHFREYIERAPVHDMEFAFDCHGDYEKMCRLLQIVVNMSKKYFAHGAFPFNLALETRLMGYSEAYLCPAVIGSPNMAGSGNVFYIEVLSNHKTPGWTEFCRDLGKEWMEEGGIPHLAKEWDFLPGVHAHIRKKLGKNIDNFKRMLKESNADPDGMFINSGLRKLLFE